jgi:hypothetical protein
MRRRNTPEELINQAIDARIEADPTRLSPSIESWRSDRCSGSLEVQLRAALLAKLAGS